MLHSIFHILSWLFGHHHHHMDSCVDNPSCGEFAGNERDVD